MCVVSLNSGWNILLRQSAYFLMTPGPFKDVRAHFCSLSLSRSLELQEKDINLVRGPEPRQRESRCFHEGHSLGDSWFLLLVVIFINKGSFTERLSNALEYDSSSFMSFCFIIPQVAGISWSGLLTGSKNNTKNDIMYSILQLIFICYYNPEQEGRGRVILPILYMEK